MKNNKKMGLILSVLFLGLFSCGDVFASSYESDIENALTQKAQRVLDGVYGPGNFIVDVDARLSAPQYSVKYTKESNPKRSRKKSDDEKVNILPGYPVIKNLGPDSLNQLPFDSVTTLSRPRVLKLSVNLLINKSFSKGQAGRAQNLLKQTLEFKENRDSLTVTFQPFYKEDQFRKIKKEKPSVVAELFSLKNMLFLGSIIWFSILFILYMILQWKSSNTAGEGSASASVNVNPNIEIPDSGGSGGAGGPAVVSDSAIKQYFDFVSDKNVDNLIYLLKKENVTPDNVSVIISFLSPKLGAKVLAEMGIEEQAVATTNILTQRLVNRTFLDKLEGRIRDWMECLVGGQSSFQKLFQFVSGESKKQLLTILGKKNPAAYKQFRENIMIFDDLALLEDDELKLVLSEANVELLSTALVSVDELTQQRVNENLTGSAKDMIRQYLDLKGQTLSKKDIEAAQDYILNIVSKLEAEGKVDLQSKISQRG